MADLHSATVIADVDLTDTVEFPVRLSATTGLLRGTFAKLKTYLKAALKHTDFSDVDYTTPATDGQALIWNNTASKWKPGSVSSGGGSSSSATTVNPSVVQYGSGIGATGSVTLGAAPTPGNLLVALGTHWTNGAAVNAGWTQLGVTNGASLDGTIIATKIATADDTATLTPYGNFNSAGLTIFEVKDWNGATFQPFNSKQEVVGTTATLNLGVPTTGSLLVGMTETLSSNTAPSSITGATAGTTTQGTTTSASPRQVTPFSKPGMTKGSAPVVVNYAASTTIYVLGMVIVPDQVGTGSGSLFDLSKGVPALSTLTTVGAGANYAFTENMGKAINVRYKGTAGGTAMFGAVAKTVTSNQVGHWAALIATTQNNRNYHGPGIGFRNSTTGKLHTLSSIFSVGYWGTSLARWTDQVTRSAMIEPGRGPDPTPFIWMHVKYDGTNLWFGHSTDGVNVLWVTKTETLAGWIGSFDQIVVGGFDQGADEQADINYTILCFDDVADNRTMGPGGSSSPNSGTAFPSSPTTGQFFYRTDRKMEYFYDGVRWLSKQLFTVAPVLPNSTNYTGTSANQNRVGIPKYGHADIYVEKLGLSQIIVGAGTTWSVAYNANVAAGLTALGPVNVSTVVSGNHYYSEVDVGAVQAAVVDFDFTYTRTAGGGTLYPMPSVMYRLVG